MNLATRNSRLYESQVESFKAEVQKVEEFKAKYEFKQPIKKYHQDPFVRRYTDDEQSFYYQREDDISKSELEIENFRNINEDSE